MGTEGRPKDSAVELAALWEEPYRHEFIQAVRILHALANGRAAVGHDSLPGQEIVRFSVHRDLGFPASQIHDLSPHPPHRASADMPPLMSVAFIGLVGPSGVLPTYYSELVVEESGADGDQGPLAAFLDMFHHRLISLFYRAWERNHPQLSPNHEVRASFQAYLLALCGECRVSPSGPHQEESLRLIRHAGLWSQKRRTAEGLRILVFDRLNQEQTMAKESDAPIQIEVISFVPRWTAVDDDRRLTLREHGAANVIGDGAVLGGRARDWQGQFRLRIGPLLARQFDLLQPLTSSREKVPVPTLFHGIVELTRRYVGPEFSFELNLVIRAEEIPQTRLLDRDRQPSRLGRTWLITRTPKDDGECIFRASNRRAGP